MILVQRRKVLLAVALAAGASVSVNAFASITFVGGSGRSASSTVAHPPRVLLAATTGDASSSAEPALQKAPVLNGKMVLPLKILTVGLKGHNIAAVYAIMNNQYKRGSGDGWANCEYVGVTRNLDESLQNHLAYHGSETVAYVRALSFTYPQKTAMEEVASTWRNLVEEAGGQAVATAESNWEDGWGSDAGDVSPEEARREELSSLMERTAFFDDDDEDEFEDDDEMSVAAVSQSFGNEKAASQTVVSPFEKSGGAPSSGGEKLPFTKENVDKVLEEVRPYLISDGGNVSVERVDEETRNVYLVLEGACGSCPSSTVTMQMGIERILKENFPDLGEVLQVEDPAVASKSTELTWEAVEEEVNRIKPAIVAMGGVVEIVSVDPIGVVELKFHGSNKVRQGVELAVLDVPFVNHVKFVM